MNDAARAFVSVLIMMGIPFVLIQTGLLSTIEGLPTWVTLAALAPFLGFLATYYVLISLVASKIDWPIWNVLPPGGRYYYRNDYLLAYAMSEPRFDALFPSSAGPLLRTSRMITVPGLVAAAIFYVFVVSEYYYPGAPLTVTLVVYGFNSLVLYGMWRASEAASRDVVAELEKRLDERSA